MNKLAVFSASSLLAFSATFVSIAHAQIKISTPAFVEDIKDNYTSIQKQISSLNNDFLQGLKAILEEKAQTKIDDFTSDLNPLDVKQVGDEIENTVSKVKSSVLELDSRILGKNARTKWHQSYTQKHTEGVLGETGQQVRQQERQLSLSATQNSLNNARQAQQHFETQKVMKRIASQNAQRDTILNSLQASMQRQNELSAVTNLNLSDISTNLTKEEVYKQNQRQGAVNAIYKNAAFLDGLWSAKAKQ